MRNTLTLLLSLALPALATDITPGLSIGTGANQIQDGQRLTSAKLLQLVSDASIQPVFYTGKVSQTNLVAGDTMLVVSGSSGTFHKLNGNQALLQNYHLITDQSTYTTVAGYDLFLLYDPTNGVFGKVAFSNLIASSAGSVIVSNLVFATTNGQNLPLYGSVPDPTSTNNQPFTMIWDTNGNPCSITYSNFLNGMVGNLGTNKLVPHVYRQVFQPQTLLSTNLATNIWGFLGVTPVTNLYFGTNTLLFTNNITVTALVAGDLIPFQDEQQHTNNTMTLGALLAWFTNAVPVTSYVSTNTNFLSTVTRTFTHGLGVTPTQVRAVLLCFTNDSPFVAGDEVSIEGLLRSSYTVGNYSLTANSSNIVIRCYSASPAIPTGSGTDMNPTAANWRYKVYARP